MTWPPKNTLGECGSMTSLSIQKRRSVNGSQTMPTKSLIRLKPNTVAPLILTPRLIKNKSKSQARVIISNSRSNTIQITKKKASINNAIKVFSSKMV
jgi:hypothetical protein